MNPRLRVWIVGSLAAVAGVTAAVGLSDGSYAIAAILLAFVLLIGIEWARRLRPEALMIGFLLVGYIIGNRGFAQVMPVEQVPVLFGELGIVLAGTLVFLRGAFARQWPWRRDILNAAVALWIIVGSTRILWDVHAHGFVAMRDFATIYYALYFYFAQAIAREAAAARWIDRCMLVAFTVLPLITLMFALRPEFFIFNLTFRGTPLIYQRGDLVAAFLFAGALLLLARRPVPAWRWVAGAVTLFAGFALFSRSGMVALAVGTGIWVLAHRWQPLKLIGVVLVLGLTGTALHGLAGQQNFRDTKVYAFYERALSIFDPAGDRTYQHADIQAAGDNNRFRIVWWRTIAAEVWDKSPLLGLGFGYDLSQEFLREYYGMAVDEEFSARSPHSIVFTMIGRLGIAGALAMVMLIVAMAARTRDAIRRVRRGAPEAEGALAHWSIAWVVLISACFGVVLEGPMGGVIFWSLLGLANAYRSAPEPSENEGESTPTEPLSLASRAPTAALRHSVQDPVRS